jgi:glycosyltransferase involved in cell wall biosynthesis
VNVVFVSHCDFRENSAMHIFSIANRLAAGGTDSIVVVPDDPTTVHAYGDPGFAVVHYDDALSKPLIFADGRGPDLIHAWTPRDLVRRMSEELSRRYVVPYIVHLEDNEHVLTASEFGDMYFDELGSLPLSVLDEILPARCVHPIRFPRFVSGAAGVTVLMDTLFEFKPKSTPGLVLWPGFDAAFTDMRPDRSYRACLGLQHSDLMVAYNGNVYRTNAAEVGSLVLAVAALRRRGYPLVLVKTGRNHEDIPYYREGKKKGFIVDLGFRPRGEIPPLLLAADVLVQPGRPGDFNDYRFPSKLPELLVSGVPVVLPPTNIGRFLTDNVNCVLLGRGHALDIAAKLEPLLREPERRRRIGAAGREFALANLAWPRATDRLKEFYDEVLAAEPKTTPAPRRSRCSRIGADQRAD